MNVLIIGGGGREHALAWKLRPSPRVQGIFCAPGNGGIAEVATCLPLRIDDHDAPVAPARAHEIGLTVCSFPARRIEKISARPAPRRKSAATTVYLI